MLTITDVLQRVRFKNKVKQVVSPRDNLLKRIRYDKNYSKRVFYSNGSAALPKEQTDAVHLLLNHLTSQYKLSQDEIKKRASSYLDSKNHAAKFHQFVNSNIGVTKGSIIPSSKHPRIPTGSNLDINSVGDFLNTHHNLGPAGFLKVLGTYINNEGIAKEVHDHLTGQPAVNVPKEQADPHHLLLEHLPQKYNLSHKDVLSLASRYMEHANHNKEFINHLAHSGVQSLPPSWVDMNELVRNLHQKGLQQSDILGKVADFSKQKGITSDLYHSVVKDVGKENPYGFKMTPSIGRYTRAN